MISNLPARECWRVLQMTLQLSRSWYPKSSYTFSARKAFPVLKVFGNINIECIKTPAVSLPHLEVDAFLVSAYLLTFPQYAIYLYVATVELFLPLNLLYPFRYYFASLLDDLSV